MSANTRKKYFIHIKGIIVVTLIGTAISLLMSSSDIFSWRHLFINLLYCFMIGMSLWFGNFSINPILERLFGKKNLSPEWKLISSLIGMLLMSSSIILFVNWFWVEVIWGEEFSKFFLGSGSFIMIIEIIVVIIIALVLYINEFFNSWREAVKNEESLKREKLALEYDSLKNQVNPHFLFNSLNTLSGLIGKDEKKATRFVKQLSDIYRYVLENKDHELVPLYTEMKFVENYISLMKIRFGDNLIVISDIKETSKYKIIPLSIQMLVENAIKHNIVSKEMPLTISFSMEDEGELTVKNNLQKKSSILQGDSGEWEKHGLLNIKSRYEYLSQGVFKVNGVSTLPFPDGLDGYFIVNVPLIR
ncbi:MAG: sensor histidine kinase [Bacteroidales bacterium]|nr:sensor histidine kinase [Bacteroidales bacterium]